jgi:hypothetical protein
MSTTTESTDTSYLITFERIGVHHDVAPLVARVRDAQHLADVIYPYARRFLFSQDVEVVVNLEPDKMLGLIVCGGFQCGGSFTIAPTPLKPVELLRAAAKIVDRGHRRDYYERAAVEHERNGGTCPGGGNCWFEKQARDELAAAGRSVTS